VVEFYKKAGFEVLSISNHDIFSDVSEYAEKHKIVLINGFEYSQSKHMLCIGGDKLIVDTNQNAINECQKQGGFVILCHPHWVKEDYWPLEKIEEHQGKPGKKIIKT